MKRQRLTRLIITLVIGVALANVSHAKETYKCKNSQADVVDKVKGYILSSCPEGVFIYKRRKKDMYQYMACDTDSGKIEQLTANEFEYGYCFEDGMAMVRSPSGIYGFIDKAGELVVEPKFVSAKNFSDGVAKVRPTFAKVGYIDKTGRYVIEPKFLSISKYHDGLAVAMLYGGWLNGYIDKTGEFVIEPKFKTAGEFKHGLALVMMDKSYCGSGPNCGSRYIDRTGEFVNSEPYETVIVNEQFEDNERGWPVTEEFYVGTIHVDMDRGYDLTIADGEYNIDHRRSQFSELRISLPRDFDPSRDFLIKAKFGEGGDSGIGVIGLMWGKYAFIMYPNGSYRFLNYDEAGTSQDRKGRRSMATKMYREFAVKKTGDKMLFFVNEDAIAYLPFEGFTERKVGFVLSGLQNFSIDSLVITQPAESNLEQAE